MAKKILLIIITLLIVVGCVVALSAFEAHVINVTADITHALEVEIEELPFGTVVPQEFLEKDFTFSLSQGFIAEPRFVSLAYDIVQKPKPKGDRMAKIKFCENPTGFDFKEYVVYAFCRDYSPESILYTYDVGTAQCTSEPLNYYNYCYYNLCPFLSKIDGDSEDANDTSALSYFQGDHCITPGEASGRLEKPGDTSDTWIIDLRVPPVYGHAAQDWPADCPTIPAEAKYGCDLWIEVTEIQTTGEGECVPSTEVCDGIDNDCNPLTADGSQDPLNGTSCDGADSDLCNEGTRSCVAGELVCSDMTGSTVDLCNGSDDDCDAASSDGSEDPLNGTSCDGADSDLCKEGILSCSAGALVCSDMTGSSVDLCNGMDDDCDPASADGSEDPLNGTACDGPDSDLCNEGTRSCSAGVLVCSDNTGSTLDLCNGMDDDCDVASADGSEDPLVGIACDGADADLCKEGVSSCSAGAVVCSDNTGTNVELCNGVDDDCDGQIDEGCI